MNVMSTVVEKYSRPEDLVNGPFACSYSTGAHVSPYRYTAVAFLEIRMQIAKSMK